MRPSRAMSFTSDELTCASSSVSTLKESYESRKSIVSEWLLKDNKHFSRELIDILYIMSALTSFRDDQRTKKKA